MRTASDDRLGEAAKAGAEHEADRIGQVAAGAYLLPRRASPCRSWLVLELEDRREELGEATRSCPCRRDRSNGPACRGRRTRRCAGGSRRRGWSAGRRWRSATTAISTICRPSPGSAAATMWPMAVVSAHQPSGKEAFSTLQPVCTVAGGGAERGADRESRNRVRGRAAAPPSPPRTARDPSAPDRRLEGLSRWRSWHWPPLINMHDISADTRFLTVLPASVIPTLGP